jgi:predicted Zn-dependent protease
MPLCLDDQRHLVAAEGWLGLGNQLEANEELEQISPGARTHPAVLSVRYEIYAKGKNWDAASEIAGALVKLTPQEPAGWICLAYANRRKSGGGTSQAKEILTQARLKFPKEYRIAYNLACYGCPLGNRKQAMQDLEEAFDLLQ